MTPVMELHTKIEADLAHLFGRRHCVLAGSGATALYAILSALDLPGNARVLYPDITCETAINASVYAGCEPVFGDIESRSFNLDWRRAADIVARDDVKVIIPTHMFGNIFDFSDLAHSLADRDVFLLEDAAQGYGGELSGRLVGQLGDASIISFGEGKLLDCGGGGAVLTDSEEMAAGCRRVIEGLPDDESAGHVTRADFMKAMFLHARVAADSPDANGEVHRIKHRHRHAFLSRIMPQTSDLLAGQLPGFRQRVEERRELAGRLGAALENHPGVQVQQLAGQSVQWRFSFLLDHDSARAYDRLNQRGVAVSRLFQPLHRGYGIPDVDFPVSVSFSERVLNVRLDVNGFSVAKVVVVLKEILDEASC